MIDEVLIDTLERIKQSVHAVLDDINEPDLTYSPQKGSNTIAWLIWHLTRVQDDHVAKLANTKQLWLNGWNDKFKLPLEKEETGYGHSEEKVALVKASAQNLIGYYDATHAATTEYIRSLSVKDYSRVVDHSWQPPVTVAVRLVSVLSDDLQHIGQAAYLKGLAGK